jgi:hypothetical protein
MICDKRLNDKGILCREINLLFSEKILSVRDTTRDALVAWKKKYTFRHSSRFGHGATDVTASFPKMPVA